MSILSNSKPEDLLLTFNRVLNKDLDAKIKKPLTILFNEMLEQISDRQHKEKISFASHHPVHMIDEKGSKSPSSFIPFCEFGENMSAMGIRIDDFDVPVCNSFKAKVLNDQLCYQVDPNVFKNSSDDLTEGLTLLIDLNEDRMVLREEKTHNESKNHGLNKRITHLHKQGITIYLDTLGEI